ncbi:MAG: hypothetical protein R3Y35_04360 [Clostridia bacterium]
MKERTTVWLDSEITPTIEYYVKKDDMKNQSEFIRKAIEFYIGYKNCRNSSKYISDILIGEMKGIIQNSETRMSRQLIHNTRELNMLLNLIAYDLNISEQSMERSRQRCLSEVINSNGAISFEQAYAFQKGD